MPCFICFFNSFPFLIDAYPTHITQMSHGHSIAPLPASFPVFLSSTDIFPLFFALYCHSFLFTFSIFFSLSLPFLGLFFLGSFLLTPHSPLLSLFSFCFSYHCSVSSIKASPFFFLLFSALFVRSLLFSYNPSHRVVFITPHTSFLFSFHI